MKIANMAMARHSIEPTNTYGMLRPFFRRFVLVTSICVIGYLQRLPSSPEVAATASDITH
jgi:hypothetical protein